MSIHRHHLLPVVRLTFLRSEEMIDEDLAEEKYFCSKNFCGKCLPDNVLIEENQTDVIDLLYKYDRSQIEVRELKKIL